MTLKRLGRIDAGGIFSAKAGSIPNRGISSLCKAVAVDVATGKPPVIGGRRQHREFLKRNHYVEVGNEPIRPKSVDYGDIRPVEVKEVIERLRSSR